MSRTKTTNDAPYWEVRRDGEPLAYGPKATMLTAEERKIMRAAGLKIYVEGKLYREEKKC